MMDQFAATFGIEFVGVRHQPESACAIQLPESESAGAQVIIDWYAHPRKGSEVEDWSPWCGEVEVEQTNSPSVSEDDVL